MARKLLILMVGGRARTPGNGCTPLECYTRMGETIATALCQVRVGLCLPEIPFGPTGGRNMTPENQLLPSTPHLRHRRAIEVREK
jgi:hypothetical protein